MRLRLIEFLMILLILPNIVAASSLYGNIDVYYNDKFLPGSEVAKPTLKIGEPFKVGIDMTVNQKCEVSVMLSELGKNDYIILNGPTTKMDVYTGNIMEKNSTRIYEWTVVPTDNWAGGSMPINFVYQINDFETGDILVNSEFTIAVPYITNEYYEGDTTPPTTTAPESPTSPETPNTTPAFTLLAAALAITLAAARRS